MRHLRNPKASALEEVTAAATLLDAQIELIIRKVRNGSLDSARDAIWEAGETLNDIERTVIDAQNTKKLEDNAKS